MNYHQIKTVFEHASSLGIKGEFARAKSVLKWLVVNTKGYDGLHYKSGISLACVYKKTLRRDSARKVYEYMIEYFKNSPRVLSLLYMDMAVLVYRLRFSWTPNWGKLLGHSYPEGERTDGIETCS